MKFKLRVALLSACALSQASAAACLLSDYSVQAEWRRSEDVVIGRLVSQRTLDYTADPEKVGGTFYTVAVATTLRGQAHGSLEIYSENSTGRFPLEKGQDYLLFVYREGDRLSVDSCGNSGLVERRHEALAEAQRLSAR